MKQRRLFLHSVIFLHHAVLLHSVVLLHLVLGEGGGGKREAERKRGGRNSERDAGTDGHLLVIPLKTGFESDGCRYIHDDPAIAFVTRRLKNFTKLRSVVWLPSDFAAKIGRRSCFCRIFARVCAATMSAPRRIRPRTIRLEKI